MRWHVVRAVRNALLAISAIALLPLAAAANGAPVRIGPGPGVAGAVAPVESDRVRLVEEQVDLEVYPVYTVGRVRYVLRNEGAATEIDFGFPTLVLESRKNPDDLGFVEYRIAVDGEVRESRSAPGDELTAVQALDRIYRFDRLRDKLVLIRRQTPGKREYSPFVISADQLFHRVRAARREYRITPLRFAANERKTVEIEFIAYNLVVSAAFNIWRPTGTLEEGFYYFCYLTTPAAAWKGTIDRADFRVTFFGTPPWTERWSEPLGPAADPEPHAREDDVLEWHFEQWEPTEDIRLLVPFAIEDYRLSRGVLERYGDSIVGASEIAQAVASSTVNRRQRPARNAFDGDPDGTAWVSGQSATAGAGETISVKLASPVEIRGVGIVPGYAFDRPRFERLGRPKAIRVVADSGFEETIELEDRAVFPFVMQANMQVFDFAAPVTAEELTFEIAEVFPGRLTRPETSVAVSEIVLFKAMDEPDAGAPDAGIEDAPLAADSEPTEDAGPPALPAADRGPRGCSCAVIGAVSATPSRCAEWISGSITFLLLALGILVASWSRR